MRRLPGLAVLDDSEIGTARELTLSITELGRTDVKFSASVLIDGQQKAPVPGVPARVPFAVPFTFVVTTSMVAHARATLAGTELAAVTFLVASAVADAVPLP